MRWQNRFAHLVVGAAIAGFAARASAQQGPSQIVGTVSDAAGKPLAEALISVTSRGKSATTDDQGRYRIEALQPDSVVLQVRRLGFRLLSVSLRLVAGENRVDVQLEEMPEHLAAAMTTVEQTGVFGVVGDTAFNVIRGATVSIAGRTAEAVTDSTGAFAFDVVRPGANLIEITAKGFKPRLFSFDMPRKGGKKLAVWLISVRSGLTDAQTVRESDFTNIMKADLANYDRRQRWKSSRAGVASREEISRQAPHMMLSEAVQFLPSFKSKQIKITRASTGLPNVFCAIVDGLPVRSEEGKVLDWYYTDEVESLELYPADSELSNSLTACAPPLGSGLLAQQSMLARRGSMVRTRLASASAGNGDGVIAVIFTRR